MTHDDIWLVRFRLVTRRVQELEEEVARLKSQPQAAEPKELYFKRSPFRGGWTTFNIRDEDADEAERRLLAKGNDTLTQADFENKALQIADDIFPFDEPPSHGNITALAAQLYQILATHSAGEQPKGAGMQAQMIASRICSALETDKDDGYDLEAGLFGKALSALIRELAAMSLSAGAQGEPVAWRVTGTYKSGVHFSYIYNNKATAEKRAAAAEMPVLTPLYAHPQPMPKTDAARDAKDAKRYRFIKSKMQVGAVQTQLPLYRTLHWIGYEDCSDVHNADAVIDAEIERFDRAKGESNK